MAKLFIINPVYVLSDHAHLAHGQALTVTVTATNLDDNGEVGESGVADRRRGH